MSNLSNLEKRTSKLVGRFIGDPDHLRETLEIEVLDRLTDNEIGVLEEYFSLLSAGFSQEEIADMMGESYGMCMAIAERAEQEMRSRMPPALVAPKKRDRKARQECIDLHGCEDEETACI